ncbi:MAG: C40 family peptidase [Acidimicrobiales bacterium]|nr:C40 family peptidase [Acidimicrobiales bacterium]
MSRRGIRPALCVKKSNLILKGNRVKKCFSICLCLTVLAVGLFSHRSYASTPTTQGETSTTGTGETGTTNVGSSTTTTTSPTSTTTTTTTPQSVADLIALQLLLDDEKLTALSEQYDQAQISIAASNERYQVSLVAYRAVTNKLNAIKNKVRQLAIDTEVASISGNGVNDDELSLINSGGSDVTASLKLEYGLSLSDFLAKSLASLKAEQKIAYSDLSAMNLASKQASEGMALISLAKKEAATQVSSDEKLLTSAGGNLAQVVAQMRFLQFGGVATPSQEAMISQINSEVGTLSPPPPGATPGEIALYSAEKQLGLPYVWGGSGPLGFDCSGLTMTSWKVANVALEHSAAAQFNETTPIALWDLQPGDLLFYDFSGSNTPANIDHVVMYAGNGLVIQAAYTGTDVMLTPLWTNDLVGAGRPNVAGEPPIEPPGTPPPPNANLPTGVGGPPAQNSVSS